MFGGSADEWKGSADKQPTLADTKVLQFGEFTKYFCRLQCRCMSIQNYGCNCTHIGSDKVIP